MNTLLSGSMIKEMGNLNPDRPAAAAGPSVAQRTAQLQEVAQAFESLFLNYLMEAMRQTVKKSELFSGGPGEAMFTGLLDQAIADRAAAHGRGLGFARMILQKYQDVVERRTGSSSSILGPGDKNDAN